MSVFETGSVCSCCRSCEAEYETACGAKVCWECSEAYREREDRIAEARVRVHPMEMSDYGNWGAD